MTETVFLYFDLQTSRIMSTSRDDQQPLLNNGTNEEPSVPAPIRTGTIAIEMPESLATKMKLEDFHFLKVCSV